MLTVDYSIFRVFPDEVVLDAGCGEGRHALALSKSVDCSIIAMDIDPQNARKVNYMFGLMKSERQTVALGHALGGDAENLHF